MEAITNWDRTEWVTEEDINWGWDTLLTELTNLMNGHDFFHMRVQNFGWQGLFGEKNIIAETAQQLLSQVLPRTECTFTIYQCDNGVIKIDNAHHDRPFGGEIYTITPIKEN